MGKHTAVSTHYIPYFITQGAWVGLTNNMGPVYGPRQLLHAFHSREPAIPMKQDTTTGQPFDKFTDTMR